MDVKLFWTLRRSFLVLVQVVDKCYQTNQVGCFGG